MMDRKSDFVPLEKSDFVPLEVESYYPKVVIRLLNRILKIAPEKVVLFGFSENMKWLLRLLKERSITPILTDWRPEYQGYDCGGHEQVRFEEIENSVDTLLIVCVEEINALKNGINYLFHMDKNKIRVIYDRDDSNIPLRQEDPYRMIFERACSRTLSISSDYQLFYLIQCIEQTKDVPGDILEFGTYNGGSGAVIAEAVKFFGEKPVWLFDTFAGIPDSKYGLDYHWCGSFSNNSFSEVRNTFSDMENVNVVKGNIFDTYNTATDGPISFGYLGSDTIESGELLMNYMWSNLSPGGVIVVADYGSFPNGIPLTVYVDEFIKNIRSDAFIFRTDDMGIYIMKHRL